MLSRYEPDPEEFSFEFLAFVNKGNYTKKEIPSFYDFAANLELLKDPQGLYWLINESKSVFSL